MQFSVMNFAKRATAEKDTNMQAEAEQYKELGDSQPEYSNEQCSYKKKRV